MLGSPKSPLKGEMPKAEGLSDVENQVTWEGTPEGFQRAIGKPFGRARRRETPVLLLTPP